VRRGKQKQVRFLQSFVLGKSVTAALIGVLFMKKFPKLKMSSEELQQYLVFKHRGKKVEAKKGKGSSYNRKEECKIPKDF
jgi:hypothetical protein